MYHVIIVLDQSRNKSYYHSYVSENGNIECEELPPYADINKAQSCYWDSENAAWVFDADKHTELVATQAAEKAAKEKARLEAEAVPSNAELALGLMEIANNVSLILSALPELSGEIMLIKGGE